MKNLLTAFIRNWRHYILFAAAPLALAACSHPQPHTEYIIKKCALPPARSTPFPADNLSPDADIFTQVQAILADRQERKADRRELEAALEACR